MSTPIKDVLQQAASPYDTKRELTDNLSGQTLQRTSACGNRQTVGDEGPATPPPKVGSVSMKSDSTEEGEVRDVPVSQLSRDWSFMGDNVSCGSSPKKARGGVSQTLASSPSGRNSRALPSTPVRQLATGPRLADIPQVDMNDPSVDDQSQLTLGALDVDSLPDKAVLFIFNIFCLAGRLSARLTLKYTSSDCRQIWARLQLWGHTVYSGHRESAYEAAVEAYRLALKALAGENPNWLVPPKPSHFPPEPTQRLGESRWKWKKLLQEFVDQAGMDKFVYACGPKKLFVFGRSYRSAFLSAATEPEVERVARGTERAAYDVERAAHEALFERLVSDRIDTSAILPADSRLAFCEPSRAPASRLLKQPEPASPVVSTPRETKSDVAVSTGPNDPPLRAAGWSKIHVQELAKMNPTGKLRRKARGSGKGSGKGGHKDGGKAKKLIDSWRPSQSADVAPAERRGELFMVHDNVPSKRKASPVAPRPDVILSRRSLGRSPPAKRRRAESPRKLESPVEVLERVQEQVRALGSRRGVPHRKVMDVLCREFVINCPRFEVTSESTGTKVRAYFLQHAPLFGSEDPITLCTLPVGVNGEMAQSIGVKRVILLLLDTFKEKVPPYELRAWQGRLQFLLDLEAEVGRNLQEQTEKARR
ncbi:Uncharacterized protein PECH_000810 [Penicillium ucsense]|uniref:Uncharacterized protein n=1 Tax=Penicillium ucsense TaxID=2839758 RepID=A0A8J8WG31_9EURO|nr:Uncharacterized protein PECM_000471 [Penicillium ucsense]KAF7733360.1 Uncharacterized protein PECH_000810 [Penicillium ucsense]